MTKILIRPEDQKYADILHNIKSKVNIAKIRVKIIK